jgi:biotin transporter BioY
MYIVAIGWLWVVLMMALTENGITAGILTFLFYGLLPLTLFLWLAGTPARRRRRSVGMADEEMRQHDGADTCRDQ